MSAETKTDLWAFLLSAIVGLMMSPIFSDYYTDEFGISSVPIVFCAVLAIKRKETRASFRIGFPNLVLWIGAIVTLLTAVLILAIMIAGHLDLQEIRTAELVFYICFIGTLGSTFLEN